MKTASFKQFTTTLMLIGTMSFSSVIYAEEVALPVISKPAILQEGTQRELSAAQIAELLPWAKNSKSFLVDLLDSIQNMTATDQVERMVEGIKSVVSESAPKNSELLMRYALNRSLVLSETLSKEMGSDEVGTIDAKVRVLKLSINMALKYYDADMETMSKKAPTNFAEFGIQYFSFLSEVNKSIFDASAQYTIQRTSLEWLQWDLYRDLNNAGYAPQIVKINNNLKVFPAKKITDAQAINYIRQMKQVTNNLNLNVIRKKSEQESVDRPSSSDGTFLGMAKESLLACVNLKSKTYDSTQALNECSSEIKRSGFDYSADNFSQCFTYVNQSLRAAESVDTCTAIIKSSTVDFSDKNFQECHRLVNKTLSSIDSVKSCLSYGNKVDFLSANFQGCYTLKNRTLTSNDTIKYCVGAVKNVFNFTDASFLACHGFVSKSLTSSESVDMCIDFSKKTNVDFTSGEFQQCYTMLNGSSTSVDSVKGCVKMMDK
ncbi:hypothetical protein SHI21_06735 [Bacteriovorax sp. PP10]|uniref:Uncharacterized protein n=1 Tax=Bacteriovorax antarcticus TaxID=3088717 RepID=A0ABU5VSI8_9BACT|nr:hypothetical protein [Bacteriovorax sp. PP10]MEA9355887.1 hypothetical protein [Bacteriovorax sp. PP10]